MDFWITQGVLLFIAFFLLLLLSMIWPPDSPWSPWWRTNKKTAIAACKLAGIKPKDNVFELGSGDAEFLIVASRDFGAKTIGIEIDPLRVFISRLIIKFRGLSGKIKIIKKNFFDVDISEADVVFVYLVPKALERLKQKLVKELKSGTRIISYRYEFKVTFKKQDKKHELYLYTISDLKYPQKKNKKSLAA